MIILVLYLLMGAGDDGGREQSDFQQFAIALSGVADVAAHRGSAHWRSRSDLAGPIDYAAEIMRYRRRRTVSGQTQGPPLRWRPHAWRCRGYGKPRHLGPGSDVYQASFNRYFSPPPTFQMPNRPAQPSSGELAVHRHRSRISLIAPGPRQAGIRTVTAPKDCATFTPPADAGKALQLLARRANERLQRFHHADRGMGESGWTESSGHHQRVRPLQANEIFNRDLRTDRMLSAQRMR